MRHDTALCEIILTCQLLVGNWSDLHANGLHLLNDVGGSGTITRGDVHRLFFFWVFLCFVPWFPRLWWLKQECWLYTYFIYCLLHVTAVITCVFSKYGASLSFEMCTRRKQSVMTHAFTHLLYAWVELMTYTTCANCSSIMRRTQQHLAGE